MTVNDFQRCLTEQKKYLAAIVAFAILICSIFVNMLQSYTAEVYIKYINRDASSGYAVDGSPLNPDEIRDNAVIKKALNQLGIEESNTEKIRKDITVTPVISVAEEEKYASWIDNFSDYEETEEQKKNAVYYSVKYKTDKGQAYASKMLNAIITQYRAYYMEKHAGNSDVIKLSEIAAFEKDYFETVEELKDKMNSNISFLQKTAENSNDYRSPRTGYSMTDLESEYKILIEKDLAALSKEILEKSISKDSSLLRASLRNKADQSLLNSERETEKASTERELMDIYSEKNKEYMWSTAQKQTPQEESSQVREDTERDTLYRRDETTYDNLTLEYVEYAANSADLLIDKKYYESYIESFYGESAVNNDVESKLRIVCDKYNELHKITEKTIEDFNNYKSGWYISQVSGIASSKTMGEIIYYAAAVILSLCLGIVAILFVELKRKRKI